MPAAVQTSWRREAVKLARTMGARGAAEEMKRRGRPVSKSQLAEWSRSELGAAPAPQSPKPVPVKATKGGKATGHTVAVVEPIKPSPDPGALPPELRDVDPTTLDFAALEELDKDVVDFRRAARKTKAVRTYAALARLQLEVRLAMHKVRPTPMVDPETDPANIEAATLLFARLDKLITVAEKGRAPA